MGRIWVLTFIVVLSGQVFAHGYQELPYSRTQYVVDGGPSALAQISYNPQQIASNLPNLTLNGGWSGSMQINEGRDSIDTLYRFNGGVLGFFKTYHPVKSRGLCTNSNDASQPNYFPILLNALPENKVSEMSYGSLEPFRWKLTAPHVPSFYAVFVTNYKKGGYRPDPSWNDLSFLCSHGGRVWGDAGATATDRFGCQFPAAPSDYATLSKRQVLVTVWQRIDAAGENFISCADVDMQNGDVDPVPNPDPTPPEEIWQKLSTSTWLSSIGQVLKTDKVVFSVMDNGVKVKSYNIKGSEQNWQEKLAQKINTPTSDLTDKYHGLLNIGQINSDNNVIYGATNNYVYLDTARANGKTTYSYSVEVLPNTDNLYDTWGCVGIALHHYLHNLKVGSNVIFILRKNGINVENSLSASPSLVVTQANKAKNVFEAQFASIISNHDYSQGVKVSVGVINDKGDASTYAANAENTVNLLQNSLSGADYSIYDYSILVQDAPLDKSNWDSITGISLNHYLRGLSAKDKLVFVLKKNGKVIEAKKKMVKLTVQASDLSGSAIEDKLAELITNHKFPDGIKLAVGIIKDGKVVYTIGEDNLVNIQTSSLGKNLTSANYSFEIMNSGLVVDPTETVDPIEHNDPIYPDGISSYKPNSTIVEADGRRYKCKPFPEGAWCTIKAPAYYRPGTGLAWQDAWVLLK